jgi:hypothetical protein
MSENEILAGYNHLMGEIDGLPEECPGDRVHLAELLNAIVHKAGYLRQLILDDGVSN